MIDKWPFKPDGSQTNNVDLHIRPYSATLERKVAFDLGPVARYDTSEGLDQYVWRARIEAGTVYICRETDAGDGWQAEEELFVADATGESIIREIDLTWDQNARATVAYQQDGAIKIWWFDPTIEEHSILTVTSSGRNPQICLDDRTALIDDSDMLLFLVQPSTDRMYYVRQRDRYDTAYELPISNVQYKYIERVTMGLDRRLYIFYTDFTFGCETIRVGAENMVLRIIRTGLYPWLLERPEVEMGPDSIQSGSIRDIIHKTSLQPEIEMGPDSVQSGAIRIAIIEKTIEREDFEMGPDSIQSGAVRAAMIEKTIEREDFEMGPDEILSASISVP